MPNMSRHSLYANTPNEIPAGEHWAIITGSTITVPGDERSRQSPGHGYPEHTESVITYQVFLDEGVFSETLADRIKRHTYGPRPVGIHVVGVYQAVTKIELSEKK